MPFTTLRHRITSRLLVALTLMAGTWAHADAYNTVIQMALHGKPEQALQQARQLSEKNPHDPQWRFLVGKFLQDMGRREEALQELTALSQEFPELPEPHNNRAVLLAARGDLAQAREALEMAIRANPDYALAHENLGDVYLRLAAAAHSRARSLAFAIRTP